MLAFAMAHVQKHADHSLKNFFKRTISAQSHLLGGIAAIVGTAFLLYFTSKNPETRGQAKHFWSCLVFGITGILVFVSSTVLHFFCDGFRISKELDKILSDIDHYSIYLFIAGTYTPFIINVISPPWDVILLTVVWTIAAIGILYTHFKTKLPHWAQHRFIYTGIFVVMGWVAIARIVEMYAKLSPLGLFLLVAGGLSYTFGAVIYATERPKLFEGVFSSHEIWHIAVMMGYAFHYFLILGFYIN